MVLFLMKHVQYRVYNHDPDNKLELDLYWNVLYSFYNIYFTNIVLAHVEKQFPEFCLV